jgi:hypothetical protein
MTQQYDEELMIKDVEALFKAQLPTEITAINTEKADALVLSNIPDDKYIFETLDSRILNYRGFFIMYGLRDSPVRESNTESFLEDVEITFQIATFDRGEKERKNTLYKLLRYRRALKAVILKNPEVFRGYAKPSIKSLKPDAFPYDNKNVILTVGVDIKASITAN